MLDDKTKVIICFIFAFIGWLIPIIIGVDYLYDPRTGEFTFLIRDANYLNTLVTSIVFQMANAIFGFILFFQGNRYKISCLLALLASIAFIACGVPLYLVGF